MHTAFVAPAYCTALLFLLCASSESTVQANPSEPPPVVFIHANIVDVRANDPDSALVFDQTVVVIGDRIVAIGKTVPIPARATVVDASGKFLIPGLWDMHVHIADSAYLAMFVANGITGVRDMGGAALDANDGCESITAQVLMAWRDRVNSGKLIGPRMLISGPAVSGTGSLTSLDARSPAAARIAVGKLRALGVDFIKIYEGIPLESYRVLAREASNVGLSIAGHVPLESVSLTDAAIAGQRSVEHVRDPLLMCFTVQGEELNQFFKDDHWSDADIEWGVSRHAQCGTAIEAFRKHRTWLVPTLAVERSKVAVEDSQYSEDPRRASMPASVLAGFKAYAEKKSSQPVRERKSERLWWETQKRLVTRMHQEKVGILAGTDSPCQGGLPGSSLHEELRLLVESGLTPLEALKTATINPATYLSETHRSGSIQRGNAADFVLLQGNPLKDIGQTLRIHAVVLRGRLLQRDQLDALVTSGR